MLSFSCLNDEVAQSKKELRMYRVARLLADPVQARLRIYILNAG